VCGARLRSLDTYKGEARRRASERLDKLDLRIMKVMLAGNGIPPGVPVMRKSFRSMAKDLRVDQGTIRSRMKKLRDQGTLKGWYLGISPALTGDSVVHAWLEVEHESDKSRLIDELVSVPGVERACNYLGPRISAVLLYREQKDLELSLKCIAISTRSNKLFHAPGAPGVPHQEIDESDAAIIQSLREDPWKPYAAVAKELRFSAKTVKRRATRLFESGGMYVVPDLDLKTLQGAIPAELVVSYRSDELKAEATERIASHLTGELIFSHVSGLRGYFALAVPNVSMVEAIGRWVGQQSGVLGVHMEVLQDVVLSPSHYKSHYLALGREVGKEPSPRTPAIERRNVNFSGLAEYVHRK
jgi:DNA-binding Lrp family transcriptional regulator